MKILAIWVLLSTAIVQAQTSDQGSSPRPFTPFRLELGSDDTYFQNAGGWWRDFDATLWIRENSKFIPALTFDSRTSNTGTQRYYSFFSYANWTSRFYTTQAISGTPDDPQAPLLFPRFRYDVKAWYKLGASRRLIPAVGLTRYTIEGQSGYILNPTVLYYWRSWIFDAEAFVNRNEPGTFWSGSALLTIQQGREGHYWAGISVGGGRQAYQELLLTPSDVRYSSTSVDAFYRKWLTRNVGIAVSGGYMDGFHFYQRFGFGTHLFFEF